LERVLFQLTDAVVGKRTSAKLAVAFSIEKQRCDEVLQFDNACYSSGVT